MSLLYGLKKVYYKMNLAILNNYIDKTKKLMAAHANVGDTKEYPASVEKELVLEEKKKTLLNKLDLLPK